MRPVGPDAIVRYLMALLGKSSIMALDPPDYIPGRKKSMELRGV